MKENELILIPKYEKYMQYVLDTLVQLPRTEKFSIGNEYKSIMYKMLENILWLNKTETNKRLSYANLIDAEISIQRILARLMYKNRWIDTKKFEVIIEMLGELGKILGGLIKTYAKNNQKLI